LTAAFVAFFYFTFIEAVALTKVLNMFSSLVATLVFARVWRVSNLCLRRIFVIPIVVMVLKTLLLDVPWANL
jgi:hypothetical protein